MSLAVRYIALSPAHLARNPTRSWLLANEAAGPLAARSPVTYRPLEPVDKSQIKHNATLGRCDGRPLLNALRRTCYRCWLHDQRTLKTPVLFVQIVVSLYTAPLAV